MQTTQYRKNDTIVQYIIISTLFIQFTGTRIFFTESTPSEKVKYNRIAVVHTGQPRKIYEMKLKVLREIDSLYYSILLFFRSVITCMIVNVSQICIFCMSCLLDFVTLY